MMRPVRLLGLLVAVLLSGCEALVTFDPWDAGSDVPDVPVDVDGDGPDLGDDGGPDGDVDVEVDGLQDDGELDGEVDGETDTGAVCGNGTVETGEDCEGTSTLDCMTPCSLPGTQTCDSSCHWAPCATAVVELCNDVDEDCDGLTDETFACRRGVESDCTTTCRSTGRAMCGSDCTLPAVCPAPAETCNGRDDDCDTVTDNGQPCIQGATVACTSSCGTTGSGLCSSACALPTGADCRPPSETCNGADDNCNGLTDEGLWGPAPSDVRVTDSAIDSIRPSVAWHVETREFGVSYADDPGGGGEIYFTRLDEFGSDLLATHVHVSTTATGITHEHPTLAWSGTQWGVVWARNESGASELRFRWLNADGLTLGTDVQVTSAFGVSNEPALVWVGTEYGVTWNDARDGNREIYFARLTTSGSKPGSYTDQRLSTSSACVSSRPSVAWTGTAYGIVWYEVCSSGDPGDIYFVKVDALGMEIPATERSTIFHSGASTWPRLVASGTGFGMVWLDDRDGGAFDQLYFARLNTDGVVIGSPVPLTTGADTTGVDGPAALGWDAARGEYLVVWSDQRNSTEECAGSDCGTELYFLRLDDAGAPIGTAARVTVAPGGSDQPWLASRGDGFGLAWSDHRDGNAEIYFNTLRCR